MKTLSSFAVVIAAALMLSGCFISDSSFITSTNADYPFGSAVSYNSTDENGITIEGMLRREGDFYRRALSGTPIDKYLLFQRLRDDY